MADLAKIIEELEAELIQRKEYADELYRVGVERSDQLAKLQRKCGALRKLAIFMMAVADMHRGDFSKEAFMLVQDQQNEWTDERIRSLLEESDDG